MRREVRAALLAGVAAATLVIGGCTRIENAMASVPFLDFMHEAPFFDPYEAPRPAPPNSVPVAGPGEKWEPPVEATDAGIRAWGDTMTNPLAMTDDVLKVGAETFMTNCAVCHGATGVGNGPIVAPGKFPLATNLMLPTTVNRTDGYMYGMIRLGRGLMPSYDRIPPSRRWAVVNYVRYLQQGNDPIPVQLPGLVMPPEPGAPGTQAGADTTSQGQE